PAVAVHRRRRTPHPAAGARRPGDGQPSDVRGTAEAAAALAAQRRATRPARPHPSPARARPRRRDRRTSRLLRPPPDTRATLTSRPLAKSDRTSCYVPTPHEPAFAIRTERTDLARGHAQVLLEVLGGEGFAQPNPRPMFPNPPGLLRVEPHSEGLRDRMWWGAASQRTATWAAELGLNLQSSTLINNESDKPFHLQQAEQIQAFRDAWQQAGHQRVPRVSVSRSIFALVDDRDRAYFGRRNQDTDEIGFIDAETQAIFGRTYAAEPDVLIQQLKE